MKAKFNIGDVIDYSGEKAVVMEVYADELSSPSYKIANKNIGDVWINEWEVKKTKQVPWTTAKAWRKTVNGKKEYLFILAAAGSERIVTAGCKTYFNMEDAYKHWSNDTDGYYFNYIHDNEAYAEERRYANEQSTKILKRLEKKVEA